MCWPQPAVLVDEDGKPIYGPVSDKEILAHLDRHSKAVMQDFYRTSEFCAACHKAALPAKLNHYKWQRAFTSTTNGSRLLFRSRIAASVLCEGQGFDLPDLPHGGGADYAAGLRRGAREVRLASLAGREYADVQVLRISASSWTRPSRFCATIPALNVDIFGIERNGRQS